MLVLGLVIILASAALTVGVVYDGSESASVEILGATLDTTVAGVFFTGAATMLLFLVGVWLLMSSMGRARRKRQERKEIRRRQKASIAALEDERTQLRAENERLSEQLDDRPDGASSTTGGTPMATDTSDSGPITRRISTDDRSAATAGARPRPTSDTATTDTATTDLRSGEVTPAGSTTGSAETPERR